MSKNTLYITFDGLSDQLGQSQILPYLVGIAKEGYSITILSCEKSAALKIEKEKIEEAIKGVSIDWKFITYDENGNSISRFLYVLRLQKMAKEVIRQKKISLTHCRSYLASLIGLSFKRKYRIPFIFDMRGYWADERMDGDIWKRTNVLHSVYQNDQY